MKDDDFDGTVVLEQLAAANLLDEFAEVVDSDDFEAAARLMRQARVDAETIEEVLRKMREADPDSM